MDKFSTRGHARFGSGREVQCYLLIFAQNMQPPSGNLREREPPGTLLKFKKPKPGRFPEPIFYDKSCSRTVPGRSRRLPEPIFYDKSLFPDRSRMFPEPFFYDESAISFGKMALFGVRSPRNLGAMQISLKMASQSDLKINTSTPKFEECFGKSIQRVFSQLSCLIHGLIIF